MMEVLKTLNFHFCFNTVLIVRGPGLVERTYIQTKSFEGPTRLFSQGFLKSYKANRCWI
jgi:hypothetical protein